MFSASSSAPENLPRSKNFLREGWLTCRSSAGETHTPSKTPMMRGSSTSRVTYQCFIQSRRCLKEVERHSTRHLGSFERSSERDGRNRYCDPFCYAAAFALRIMAGLRGVHAIPRNALPRGERIPLHFWAKRGPIFLPKLRSSSEAQYQACKEAGLI